MRICGIYSHLNGHEFIIVRKPELWAEIEAAIGSIKPKTKGLPAGDAVEREFIRMGWRKADSAGKTSLQLIKDRISLNQRLTANRSDPIAEFLRSYSRGDIDVGIDIVANVPSSGSEKVDFGSIRSELMLEGRGSPRVPLVLIGIASD